MTMYAHSLYRAANMVGLTAVSATSAFAAVPNHRTAAHEGWTNARPGAHVRNSVAGVPRSATRRLAISERAGIAKLRQAFATIHALSDGWDGGNSVAPHPEVVARAASILEYALNDVRGLEVPTIVPVADGGLQAEWYAPAYRFEVYFEADGEIAAWSENRVTGVELEAEGRDAIQMLVTWTASLDDERVDEA